MRVTLIAAALLLSGCSVLTSTVVDCELQARCGEVVAQATPLLPTGAARITVNDGRARAGTFHAEVHACYRDGRYFLVDVLGAGQGPLSASIRPNGLADPPCR